VQKHSETNIIRIEGAPCVIDTGRVKLHFSIETKPKAIPADTSIACLDMKNIEFPLTLRKWRLGDYFYPLGMGMKKKKVARFLIDQKMPIHNKEHVWVLECSKRIGWVCGLRIDERFKVKDSTEKVLMVKLQS
jgi:tRNA(Ile)-lysidine synthase